MKDQNWLASLMKEVEHVETPRSWIWWSLVTAISAAAGNNYHLRTLKGVLVYKPNLYVMLLGDSGLGKGFPVNLAKLLVSQADCTRVIAGRSSIQAIVNELGTAKSTNGKPPILDSRGFIVNGELSAAIIADVDALAILTDLYDGHYNPEWSNLLKGEGVKTLKDPYITTLFGSSPAHFYDSIPQANIEGGYIGRNLVVYEEKRYKDVDLLDEDNEEIDKLKAYIIPHYAQHLYNISKGKGRLIPHPDAKEIFNNWRRQWREKQAFDRTGFLNRVPDHVLKVSMCLSLARESNAGVINEEDMAESIAKVTGLIYANKMTTEGKGLDPAAAQKKMVLDFLIRADKNKLSRKQLLSKGYGSYDTVTLDRLIEDLLEMGWITRSKDFHGPKGADWIIHLAGEPLEKYNEFKKGLGNK